MLGFAKPKMMTIAGKSAAYNEGYNAFRGATHTNHVSLDMNAEYKEGYEDAAYHMEEARLRTFGAE